MSLSEQKQKPETQARSSRELPNSLSPDGHDARDEIIFSYSDDSFPKLKQTVIKAIERASGQRRLKRLYDEQISTADFGAENFFDVAIKALQLNIQYDAAQLAKVPADGPVLFVANHPYGVLDGISLTWLARQARTDVKVLAHRTLCQIPSAQPNLLPIDFASTAEAQAITLNSRVVAQKHLRSGGAIGIFPGGGVATSLKPWRGAAADPPWHPFTGKMVISGKPTVVPIYFSGQNSRLFQLASHMSYTLRLSLMFYETARRRGSHLHIGIGDPIPFEHWQGQRDRQLIVQELRRRTLAMASDIPGSRRGADDPDRIFEFPKSWG